MGSSLEHSDVAGIFCWPHGGRHFIYSIASRIPPGLGLAFWPLGGLVSVRIGRSGRFGLVGWIGLACLAGLAYQVIYFFEF